MLIYYGFTVFSQNGFVVLCQGRKDLIFININMASRKLMAATVLLLLTFFSFHFCIVIVTEFFFSQQGSNVLCSNQVQPEEHYKCFKRIRPCLTHCDFSHQTGAPTLIDKESREPQTGKNVLKLLQNKQTNRWFQPLRLPLVFAIIVTKVSHSLPNLASSEASLNAKTCLQTVYVMCPSVGLNSLVNSKMHADRHI